MNWKLTLQLSMFGLAMGVATVFLVPSRVEPMFWLIIFVVCAYVIATRQLARPFLHGVMIGLVNSVWVTAAHVLFFDTYAANHRTEMDMMSSMPLADSPKLLMALTGPAIGLVSGFVLGVLALAASKLVRPRISRE